jgi:hypothetical protein
MNAQAFSFNAYAQKNIRIDQDNNGLFALVPSQSGKWMKVNCEESKTSVTATSCSCGKSNCNHVEQVQAYWNKIYKVAPKVEAPVVAKVRKPRNGLVRKVRNGGLVLVATPSPVAKVIELPTKVTDISQKGNFGTRAFSLMR